MNQSTIYCIAGSFRKVPIFAFFEEAHLFTKLKHRPSSTSKTAAQELTAPNHVVHACRQQRDGCKTSWLALESTRETGSLTWSVNLLVSATVQ